MDLEFSRHVELAVGLLLSVTLKSVLLLSMAAMLVLALKRAPASARHLLWFATLVGVLCLPLASVLPAWKAPAWAAPVSQGLARLNEVALSLTGDAPAPLGSAPARPAQPATPLPQQSRAVPAGQVDGGANVPWLEIIFWVWIAGAVTWLAGWITGLFQLRRISRKAQPCSNPGWYAFLQNHACQLGIRHPVRLLVVEEPVIPMTWGWRRPIVLLPSKAEEWPAERLELVLHHELAHIRRRDYLTQNIAGLACAFHWFNPLVWYAARRMRAERELACDDLVLSAGARPSTYAGHLLEIALQFRGQPTSASLPMARSGELEQRLRAVVAEDRNRGGASRAFALTLAAMLAVLVAFLGTGARSAAVQVSLDGTNLQEFFGEQATLGLLQDFFTERAALARVLEAKAKQNDPEIYGDLPTNVWAFFAAGAKSDWPAMTNAWTQLRGESPQFGGTLMSLRGPAFQPIMEAYGAYEQSSLLGEKYARSFTESILESLPPHSVLFAGTDPARFLITATLRSQPDGDPCFVLTQIALVDGTYLEYLRVAYGDQIYIPTPEDSERSFREYLTGAQQRLKDGQLKPGEDIQVTQGRVQVRGKVAVMAINALLARVIFDRNPDREFFIEESFPLDWMYPHLTPHGLILKLNRRPLDRLGADTIRRDQQYWAAKTAILIGDWLRADTSLSDLCAFSSRVFGKGNLEGFKGDAGFVRNPNACSALARARTAIAGVYQWRMEHSDSAEVRKEMAAAADFAYRQAFALCPYSPEAVSRYARFLQAQGRLADAGLVTRTALALKPDGIGNELERVVGELDLGR